MVRGLVSCAILGATALSFNMLVIAPASATPTLSTGWFQLNGQIRFDPSLPGKFAFGNENSGPLTCPTGAVDVPGIHGLFNCGSPDPGFNPNPPNNVNGDSSIISRSFISDPQNVTATENTLGCTNGDSTSYTSSGAKLGEGPVYATGRNVNGKDDLSNAYFVARTQQAGDPSPNDKELYFGLERAGSGGDDAVDIEFLQGGATMAGCAGPLTVHREQGDFAVEFDWVGGGGTPSPVVLVWTCGAPAGANPPAGTGTPCDYQGLNYPSAQYVPLPACTTTLTTDCVGPNTLKLADNSAQNIPGTTPPVPGDLCGGWVCANTVGTNSSGLDPSTLVAPQTQFVEGGIDLNGLGIQASCASTVLPSSHEAQSFTSALKDFAGPANFSLCPDTTTTKANNPTSSTIGNSWTDTATVTGNFGTPQGNVTFYSCNPTQLAANSGSCTKDDGTIVPGTQPVGLGSVNSTTANATSPPLTPNAVGTWCFVAYYSGQTGVYAASDDSNPPGTSPPTIECFAVTKATPVLKTSVEDSLNMPIINPVPLGTSVHDTATVTGGDTPTGMVKYDFQQGSDTCHGTTDTSVPNNPDTVTIGTGTPPVPNSGPTGPLGAGMYSYSVTYLGDANNNSVNVCEAVDVGQAQISVSTVVYDAANNEPWSTVTPPPAVGATAYDTTKPLTGFVPGISISGKVTYTLFGPDPVGTTGCQGTGVQLGTGVPVDPTTGDVPNSPTTAPLAAGNYGFEAQYNDDANYKSSLPSDCEPFSVAQVPLTLKTTPHTGSDITGTSVTDSAVLNGQVTGFFASGTVTYKLFNGTCDSVGTQILPTDPVTVDATTGLVPDSGSFGPLPAGPYVFEVTYGGDTNYSPITTPDCEPFTIGPATLTLKTTPHTGSDITGATVTDSAVLNGQVSPFDASGTVTYKLFHGTCDSVGTQILPTDPVTVDASTGLVPDSGSFGPLPAGPYVFEVTYGGDTNYSPITTPDCEPFTIGPATLTLMTTPHTGTGSTGATVTDSAVLNGQVSPFDASGTVTYKLFNGTCDSVGTQVGLTDPVTVDASTGLVPDSGSFGPLPAGPYVFEVTYGGDTNYKAITTPDCEPFTIAPLPSGVTTTVMDLQTGMAWVNGGTTEVVGQSAFDTSTITGQATGVPATGTMTYKLFNGTCESPGSQFGSTDGESVSTVGGVGVPANSKNFGPLPAGNYFFTATYSGDTNYGGSTDSCEPFSVAQVPLTLKTTPHTGSDITGTSVTDSAVLNGQVTGFFASGTVTYKLFHGTCDSVGTQVGTNDPVTVNASTGLVPDSGSFGPLGAGPYVFEVTYGGDTNYSPITTPDCEPFTVGPATPTLFTTLGTRVNSNVGSSENDSATVTGTSIFAPAGSVRFQLCKVATGDTTCSGGSLIDFTLSSPTNSSWDVSNYDLPSGDAFTPTATGTYCYNVSYASGNDPNYLPVSEQSDNECFVVTNPFFTIAKSDKPGNGQPVAPGSTIPYTVVITNTGDGTGTDALVSDTIPSNLTISGTPDCAVSGASPDKCTVNQPASGSTTWTFDVTLAAGDTATVTFSAVVAATDTADLVNTATLSGVNPCVPSQTATDRSHATTTDPCSSTVTNPVPDFTVAKTDTPGSNTPVAPGSTIPYTVAVKNVGDGAGTAVISDPIPSNLTISGTPSCSAPSGTCTASVSGSTLTVNVNNLAAGDTATVTFSAVVAAGATGTITNTATITAGPCNTSAGCSANVSNPIIVVTAATVPPPPPPAPVIAFTGADIAAMVAAALALLGLGGFLVLISRRRRREGHTG